MILAAEGTVFRATTFRTPSGMGEVMPKRYVEGGTVSAGLATRNNCRNHAILPGRRGGRDSEGFIPN